jgi:hypothetical protein
MKSSALLALAALALIAAPVSAQRTIQSPCQAPVDLAVRVVEDLDDATAFPAFREDAGLVALRYSGLRALGTPQDTADQRAACRALNDRLRAGLDFAPRGVRAFDYGYFAADYGETYIVTRTINPPPDDGSGRVASGLTYLHSFRWQNGQIEHVAGVGF